MVDLDWGEVGIGATLTLIGLLPLTGYWYESSELYSTCPQRIDVLLTLACVTVVVSSVVIIGAMNLGSHYQSMISNFAYVMLSWLLAGGLFALDTLQAVVTCWLKFHSTSGHASEHLVVFILYAAFAIIYGLPMTIMGCYILFSDEISFYKVRRRERKIQRLLHQYICAHCEDPGSEAAQELCLQIFEMSNRYYPSLVPISIRKVFRSYFFPDIVFHEYEGADDHQITGEEIKSCVCCLEDIGRDEKFWQTDTVVKMGNIHLKCFLKSRYIDTAFNNMNQAFCTAAYEDYRKRRGIAAPQQPNINAAPG